VPSASRVSVRILHLTVAELLDCRSSVPRRRGSAQIIIGAVAISPLRFNFRCASLCRQVVERNPIVAVTKLTLARAATFRPKT
jgi:hypothetical protein